MNIDCYGIDPSKKAIKIASTKNVKAYRGTAEKLKFFDQKFDFLIFGFCLYLCDRDDLFKIAYEADRVLKPNGYIIIYDFFSNTHKKIKYSHHKDVFSYKMDYRKLFRWHPFYSCVYHKQNSYIGLNSDFTSISVMKKNINI